MFILFYDYVPDIAERRGPHRAEHLALLEELHEKGLVLMAGALDEPLDTAVIVFTGTDREPVVRFVDADPYVANGLVKEWRIRPWNVVVGRPEGVA